MKIKKLLFYLVMFFYFSTANAWNWRSVYNLEPDISDSKEEKFNWLVHEIKNKFEKTDRNNGVVKIYDNPNFTIKVWIRNPNFNIDKGYGNDFNNDIGECNSVIIVNYILYLLEQKNWKSWISIKLDLEGKVNLINSDLKATNNEFCGPHGLWNPDDVLKYLKK